MLRTTAASLIALATAILPAGAQTVLYGEQPPGPSILPQQQPYFIEPQPQPYYVEPQGIPQPTQPLYYESVPAPLPPAIYEPETPRFRAIPQPGVTQTRPLAPVEQYRAPQPQPQQILTVPVAPQARPAPPPRPAPFSPAPPPPPPPAPVPEVTESEALLDFSEELARIVALGERYRAASPGFLEDLKSLSQKYRTLPVLADAPEETAPDEAPEETAATDLIGPPSPAEASAMENGPDEADDPVEPVAATETAEDTDDTPGETEVAMLPDPEPVPEPEPEAVPEPEPEPQELPQALPPTSAAVVYLRDDFADGDYLTAPTWNVRQGQFTIDSDFGLRPLQPEAAEPPRVTPQALLQYLIGEGEPRAAEPVGESGASLIEAQTDIGNAFSMVATITDHGGEGAAHFIMHQGGANWLGYRLELRAGPRPLVVLARRGSSGYKDIMKVEAPGFTTGKPHQLRWARLSDGQMFVLIDGRPIITARDTVFRQGWAGFAYFTADADISMRNIRIAEPVER